MRLFRGSLLALIALLPQAAAAQPFGNWFNVSSGHGYVATPNSADLNFTNGFTFEAWVSIKDAGGCSSIAGKNFQQAWWIGICGTSFRSYIKGTASQFTSGTVPASTWTHIAVTYDGTTRRHYIDGELVASHPETGNMTTSTDEMRIGSDTAWQFTPQGGIDDVRIWNVARTTDQIRSTINTPLTVGASGLVALYHFDGNAADSAGSHTGTLNGTGAFVGPTPGGTCVSNATTLCFESGRFSVTAKWQAPDGSSGVGTVVPGASSNSGLFWFFGADNWELLIKELNGCGLNNRRWVFSAATTNVHYNITVTDFTQGVQRHYLNYQGVAAAAVNDTQAFATCP